MPFQDRDQPQGDAQRICLGKIAAPHGVKGLVKILSYGEDPSLIEGVREHKITLKNRMGKYILAEVDGCNSREDAESLKGVELYIDKSTLPPIEDDDTYYYADLVGMECVDEAGEHIGIVKAVQNYGAGDLLEISSGSSHSVLIPFTHEYVPDITETICLSDAAKIFMD